MGSAGVGVVGFCPQNPHFCWVSLGFWDPLSVPLGTIPRWSFLLGLGGIWGFFVGSGGFHPKIPWLIGWDGTLGSVAVGVVGFCPKIPISVGFHWDFGILCRFWWVSPQNRMAYRVGWDFGVCGCWGRWVLPPKSPFLLGFVGILGSFVGSVGFYPKMVIFGWVWVGFWGFLWVPVGFTPKSHGL